MRLFLALGFLISLLAAACSHHHYGYYEPPRDFHHDHWLLCGHYVACRYYRGAHHFRPHQSHREYYHRHRGSWLLRAVPCRARSALLLRDFVTDTGH